MTSRESLVHKLDATIMEHDSSLLSTNEDLQELCILLDEERCKMHQLAEQWKHFGKNTISKLAAHIVDYQSKMRDLEQRQILLLKENESLKSLANQLMATKINNNDRWKDEHIQRTVSTQTSVDQQEFIFNTPIEDSFQHEISLQNMFDAIKTAEIYESIGKVTGNDASEKIILKQFCHLIWKYLEEHSKIKQSCLL